MALAAALAGCDAPAGACGDGVVDVGALCFAADEAVRVGYGFAPTAMVAADLDGDGSLDVAASSPSTQTVTIMWGPTRETATSWALGEEIAGLAIGDVDGDGRLDVVTALPGSDAMVALHGRGGRVFERADKVRVGAAPRGVLVVDLDGDGRGEIVTADVGDGSVSVVRGGEVERVIVGAGPHALAAGQLDGVGGVDVAVALADSAEVQILSGDGRGGLLPGQRFRVGAGPLAMVAADFDGDGVDEVATADALDDTVTVIGRDVRTWAVPARPSGLVVVRDAGGVGLGVLSEGTGEVTRLDPRTGAQAMTLVEATGLAAGDLDGDGSAELVVGSAGATFEVRRGDGDGWALREAWDAQAWFGRITPMDADGDGRDELLIDGETSTGLLLVDGADGTVIGAEIVVPGFSQSRALVPADVDGDGDTDIVVAGKTDGAAVQSLLQQDDGTFIAAGEPLMLEGTSAETPVSADFTGDGVVDLAVVVKDRLWLLGGDGDGGFMALGMYEEVVDEVTAAVVADVGGGSTPDLVILTAGSTLITVVDPGIGGPMISNGLTGLWSGMVVVPAADGLDAVVCGDSGMQRIFDVEVPWFAEPEVLTADPCERVIARDGDLDGDVDVFAYGVTYTFDFDALEEEEPGIGDVAVVMLRNDGAGGLALASRQAVPYASEGAVFAELDGVPAPDFVTTDDLLTTALYGRMTPVLLAAADVEVGGEEIGRFADLNGDGVKDRVQAGPGIAVALANGDGGFLPWQHASLAGLTDPDVDGVIDLATGDLDGDGKDEAVLLSWIANPLPLRAVTVVRLAEDGSLHGETVARLASFAAQVLVADLDGDARDEVLVAEGGPEGPRVAVLRMADGFAAVMQMVEVEGRVVRWGLADMRGDGILDLVIARTSDSPFYSGPADLLVARGQGDGGFGGPSPWGSSYWPGQYWLRDVDGDRSVDLLMLRGAAYNSRDLLLVRGGPDGRSEGAPRRLLRDVDTATFADLDGDGVAELLTGYASSGDWPVRLTIGVAAGGGAYVLHSQALSESGASTMLQELAVHDWDGDGRPDIAAVDETGFTIVRQRP